MRDQIAKSHSTRVAEHDIDSCDWPKSFVVTSIYYVSSRIYHSDS